MKSGACLLRAPPGRASRELLPSVVERTRENLGSWDTAGPGRVGPQPCSEGPSLPCGSRVHSRRSDPQAPPPTSPGVRPGTLLAAPQTQVPLHIAPPAPYSHLSLSTCPVPPESRCPPHQPPLPTGLSIRITGVTTAIGQGWGPGALGSWEHSGALRRRVTAWLLVDTDTRVHSCKSAHVVSHS